MNDRIIFFPLALLSIIAAFVDAAHTRGGSNAALAKVKRKKLSCKQCKKSAMKVLGRPNCFKRIRKITKKFSNGCRSKKCRNKFCTFEKGEEEESCIATGYCDKKPTTDAPTKPPTVKPTPKTVVVEFGYSQVTACKGDIVKVKWKGYHNIQETKKAWCQSGNIGAEILGFVNPNFSKDFTNNELTAPKGGTRYFKCSYHCGTASNRFEVSCPP